MRGWGLAVMALAGWATPVGAQQPYYFAKPGVGRAAYVADVSECSELAGGASYRSGPVYITYQNNTAGAAGAAIGMIMASFMAAKQNRAIKRVVERTCMADKGYKRMKVDRALIKSLNAAPEGDARVDRFFAVASAETPVGEEMGE